jgi:hypothetical protein
MTNMNGQRGNLNVDDIEGAMPKRLVGVSDNIFNPISL